MKQKGFTIVEMVIAVFLLAIAIIGIYSAFSTIFILTSNISDRFTAVYLAQEGVEIVRNIRDNNWIDKYLTESGEWTDGLLGCQNGCEADYTTGTTGSIWPSLSTWPVSLGGNELKIDSYGFYNYTSGLPTKFKRKITINQVDESGNASDYILKVEVQVFWKEKPNILNSVGSPGYVTVEEYFYNWF